MFSTGEWIPDVAPEPGGDQFGPRPRTAVYSPADNDAIPVAVCPVDDDFRPAEVAAANAALISAAPDLFAVAKAVLAGDNRAWEKATAAVRKATTIEHQPSAVDG